MRSVTTVASGARALVGARVVPRVRFSRPPRTRTPRSARPLPEPGEPSVVRPPALPSPKHRVLAMSGEPTPEEGKYKDIPSILPLAPGGVYAVKWEQREKWAECLRTPDVPYTPPLGAPNPDNPVCFFEIRRRARYYPRPRDVRAQGGHGPGDVRELPEAVRVQVLRGDEVQGVRRELDPRRGLHDLDEAVYDANDPDFFDFATAITRRRAGRTERLRVRRRAVLRGRVLRHHARQAWGFDERQRCTQLQRQFKYAVECRSRARRRDVPPLSRRGAGGMER